MSQTAALAEDTAGTVATGDLAVEFHTLGLAGCIDRLTAPLRRQGVLIRWETPHHGIEIPAASAVLLYRAAQEHSATSTGTPRPPRSLCVWQPCFTAYA